MSIKDFHTPQMAEKRQARQMNKKGVIPARKTCLRCRKRRVTFHHHFCNPCWDVIQSKKQKPEVFKSA